VSLYFTTGRHLPQKLAHSHGTSGPPSNTWFVGPTRAHSPNGISISSAFFVGLTAKRLYTLQWIALFPKIAQLAPCHGGIWTPSLMHDSLSPHSLEPKRRLDRFSRFCRAYDCDRQTNGQTDRATRSVSRIHVRSTAIRPNNNSTKPTLRLVAFDPLSVRRNWYGSIQSRC